MTAKPNILLIMSDEHDPAVTGCYGHSCVQTPNLDRLASDSAVFDNAYTNSPICVPARACFMTGRYAHQIGSWDNSAPLPSSVPTIGTYMETAGYDTVLCGRTHFVGPDRMHGWGKRLLDDLDRWQHRDLRAPDRSPTAQRFSDSHVTECGPGAHFQNDYDREATNLACGFLRDAAEKPGEQPWLLYCGWVNPHFPLICPPEYFELYHPDKVLLPATRGEPLAQQHPMIRQLRHWLRNEETYDDDFLRQAIAAYYGCVSFTDEMIGQLLEVIDNSSLRENTIVIYTSDHGEMGGAHGFWQKQCFYEQAARVPLIVHLPGGRQLRVPQHVSLIDVLPTLLDIAGTVPPDELSGISFLPAIQGEPFEDRPVFSEYHTFGNENAGYMIKQDNLKYVHYVGHEPLLYDLDRDPEETCNLANDPAHADDIGRLHQELLKVADPAETDRRAKANQRITGIARADATIASGPSFLGARKD